MSVIVSDTRTTNILFSPMIECFNNSDVHYISDIILEDSQNNFSTITNN